MPLLVLRLLVLVLFIVISIIASIIPSTILLIWRKSRKKCAPDGISSSEDKTHIVHNVIIEFLRSFDCGLLLATFFLHLIPYSRKTFELFFLQMSASTVKSLVLVRTDFVDTFEYKGIPFVELMTCLSFFGIYFCEEFIQTCLKYRKYYWFHNSSIIYSNQSSDLGSLDYRLNKTRHYLISCSRKTSEATSYSNTCSTKKASTDKRTATTKIESTQESEEPKDSLEVLSLPYDSLEPTSLASQQLPSYWRTDHKSVNNSVKLYLPQLTCVNSMPVLTVLEGVIVCSQETHHVLLLAFVVILFHKIITSFTIISELFDRTDSKLMPISTIMTFTVLPAVGFLVVVGLKDLIFVETTENRILSMVLSVISSGSLLHLLLINVRNSYMQFLMPHRNGIVQHFTMYSGFIVILGFTAIFTAKP